MGFYCPIILLFIRSLVELSANQVLLHMPLLFRADINNKGLLRIGKSWRIDFDKVHYSEHELFTVPFG